MVRLSADNRLSYFDTVLYAIRHGGVLDEVSITSGLAEESLRRVRNGLLNVWDASYAASFETCLRALVVLLTPGDEEHKTRVDVIMRYNQLAQTGINFVRGFELKPFGSFVSGLYTCHGDLDFSIEGSGINEFGAVVSVENMERGDQERYGGLF